MSTIAAIATPPGVGALGIVRISGPMAKIILNRIFEASRPGPFKPWHLRRGIVAGSDGEAFDNALAVYMPGPNTFTGEDTAEFYCHGNPVILESLLGACLDAGARIAEPGEFSKRAYLNGRMDLSQAEAVAELIAAPTPGALRHSLERLDGKLGRLVRSLAARLDDIAREVALGLDFPDDEVGNDTLKLVTGVKTAIEDIEALLKNAKIAHTFQNGAMIVLAGAVNAGKSSLLNALCGRERALVTDFPGTTRDFVEVDAIFKGIKVRLVDTAGLDQSEREPDYVEKLGQAKTRSLIEEADIIFFLVDGSDNRNTADRNALWEEIRGLAPETPRIVVWNKNDICAPRDCAPKWTEGAPFCQISALTGDNLDALIHMSEAILLDGEMPDLLAPNLRQTRILTRARDELAALLTDIDCGVPLDCAATRLDAAISGLNDIIGLSTSREILDQIFSQFCIGK